MIVLGGKLRTVRMVSLCTMHLPTVPNEGCKCAPYLFAHLEILLETVPHGDNVLALSHANGTATDFGPILALDFSLAARIATRVGLGFTTTALVEEIAGDAAYQILPYPICDTLAKPYDPLAASPIQGVFPYRSPDASMEQQIVGGGDERRRRGKMRVERPKGLDLKEKTGSTDVDCGKGDTHRGKRSDLFDSLFVIGDLVPRCPLLAEPENPTKYAQHATEGQHGKKNKRIRWQRRTCF